jgi:hypothetical protein
LKRKAKARRPAIRFKGWDWMELLQLEHIASTWPKLPKEFNADSDPTVTAEDAEAAYLIREYLRSLLWVETVEAKREAARVLRYVQKFCRALSKHKACGDAPIYAGMAEVKCSWTLFTWVDDNLQRMWT